MIISDMQTMDGGYGKGVSEAVPPNVPIYGFNLGGYQHTAYATGSANRHEFGGWIRLSVRAPSRGAELKPVQPASHWLMTLPPA